MVRDGSPAGPGGGGKMCSGAWKCGPESPVGWSPYGTHMQAYDHSTNILGHLLSRLNKIIKCYLETLPLRYHIFWCEVVVTQFSSNLMSCYQWIWQRRRSRTTKSCNLIIVWKDAVTHIELIHHNGICCSQVVLWHHINTAWLLARGLRVKIFTWRTKLPNFLNPLQRS